MKDEFGRRVRREREKEAKNVNCMGSGFVFLFSGAPIRTSTPFRSGVVVLLQWGVGYVEDMTIGIWGGFNSRCNQIKRKGFHGCHHIIFDGLINRRTAKIPRQRVMRNV